MIGGFPAVTRSESDRASESAQVPRSVSTFRMSELMLTLALSQHNTADTQEVKGYGSLRTTCCCRQQTYHQPITAKQVINKFINQLDLMCVTVPRTGNVFQ